ncbi:unnamed protein product, partial [Polarella glacialis]
MTSKHQSFDTMPSKHRHARWRALALGAGVAPLCLRSVSSQSSQQLAPAAWLVSACYRQPTVPCRSCVAGAAAGRPSSARIDGSFAASLCGPAVLAVAAASATRFATKAAKAPAEVISDEPPDEVDIYGRIVMRPQDGSSDEDTDRTPGQYVVKVYCVHSCQDNQQPWTNKPQEESSGSGCAIFHNGEQCILTNAHVVSDASYVEVRKAGDAKKYTATRVKLAHECDLALLRVSDKSFWEGVIASPKSKIVPLEFGSMPSLQDEVSVVGYPEGGEGVSITQGVVSRIEIQTYVHSGASLLAIQIDAAINPGNSGGPALDEDGDLIGIAFQNQQQSQNIGYVIPVPTIQHFLADTDPEDSGRCMGFCSLGLFWQELVNEQLRRFMKLGPERHGVLVRGLMPLSLAEGLVQRGDVLLAMDGKQVANDGTILVGHEERLSFQHLIHLKFPGDKVHLILLRDNQEVSVDVPVRPMRRLVCGTVYDNPQPYFLYGGIVFVPLTTPYLQEWGDEWRGDGPHDLVTLALVGLRKHPEEQVVILSKCLPNERTAGYSSLDNRQVIAVCGEPVLNLKQMYELVKQFHKEKDFIEFTLQCIGGCNASVAIDTSSADAVCEEIMSTYRIPSAVSAA